MFIPWEIWLVLLTLAIGCTGYMLRIKDRDNYTEAICGVLSTLFWLLSGYTIAIGIQAEGMAYSSTSLMWIFVAIGVIVGILTFVKVLDIISRKDSNTNLGRIRL
jgi:hypothetical protein